MPLLAQIILWLLCGLLGLFSALALTAYVREKLFGRPPGKHLKLNEEEAFVGSAGLGVPLAIRREGNRLTVRWGLSNYLLTIGVAFLFGPGVVALLLVKRQELDGIPAPVAIIVAILVLWATVAFAQQLYVFLVRRPRVEVGPDGVGLHRGSRSEPVRALGRQEIAGLTIEESTYRVKSREHPELRAQRGIAGREPGRAV